MTNPIFINNLDFAKKNQEITGVVLLSDLPRLVEAVHPEGTLPIEVHYQLRGVAKKLPFPSLHLKIASKLPVLCQRCLESMSLEMMLDYQYVISPTEPTEFADDDEIEWLESSKEMNLIELIEDELLMALPIAPTHHSNCAPSSIEVGEKLNPFAVLKDRLK
jgi:uncharacterized protein